MNAPGNASDPTPSINDLPVRVAALNTRIDDLKGTVTLIVSGAAILFGLMSIVFAWNASSEKADLRAFRTEIRNEVQTALGRSSAVPEIKFGTMAGSALNGATLTPTLEHNSEGDLFISVPLVIRNVGRAWSGDLALKVYTKKGIPMEERSTDEAEYSFEQLWIGKSEQTGIDSLPGGLSHVFDFALWPTEPPAPGPQRVLYKIYYGSGLVSRAEVTLLIPERR